jgi:hypothetical protein
MLINAEVRRPEFTGNASMRLKIFRYAAAIPGKIHAERQQQGADRAARHPATGPLLPCRREALPKASC